MINANEREVNELLKLSADIVCAHLSSGKGEIWDAGILLRQVYNALSTLYKEEAKHGTGSVKSLLTPTPAVPPDQSITPDYLVCLEDGKRLKMLKRYLRSQYNMSPEEYRKRWNLPDDYPMIAPAYAKQRSEVAKKNGLGKKEQQVA